MNLKDYLQRKAQKQNARDSFRSTCELCRKPKTTCYCAHLRPFQSAPRFIILIHKEEARRSIATGRMTHLSLKNSLLFEGTDFSQDEGVNALIEDPTNFCVVLSPGSHSVDISRMSAPERRTLFPENRLLNIFVIDGTWTQAKRMKRLSRNISSLPAICFTPSTPSQFLVRRQPATHCYATIEAVHMCLQLLDGASEKELAALHDVFTFMVNQQLKFETIPPCSPFSNRKFGNHFLPD